VPAVYLKKSGMEPVSYLQDMNSVFVVQGGDGVIELVARAVLMRVDGKDEV